VVILHPKLKGVGLVMSNDLHDDNYQVQTTDGKMKAIEEKYLKKQ